MSDPRLSDPLPVRLPPNGIPPELRDRPTFIIDYVDSAGNNSRRWVTFDSLFPPEGGMPMLHCFCHRRREIRSFRLDRIAAIIDGDGVIHQDTANYLQDAIGLPVNEAAKFRGASPAALKIAATGLQSNASRSKEKHDLWGKTFRHPAVIEVYRKKLIELFYRCCFRCGATDRLEVDHHVPWSKGDRLEPGNLVVLCARCNNLKREIDPEVWYTREQLDALDPLLEEQKALFEFRWDWAKYNEDKEAYLLSLGVDAETVRRIFHDPDYAFYMGD